MPFNWKVPPSHSTVRKSTLNRARPGSSFFLLLPFPFSLHLWALQHSHKLHINRHWLCLICIYRTYRWIITLFTNIASLPHLLLPSTLQMLFEDLSLSFIICHLFVVLSPVAAVVVVVFPLFLLWLFIVFLLALQNKLLGMSINCACNKPNQTRPNIYLHLPSLLSLCVQLNKCWHCNSICSTRRAIKASSCADNVFNKQANSHQNSRF